MTTTAIRPAYTAPLGRGAAHQALDDSRERAKLNSISATIGCAPGEVSADGIHADMPSILAALRRHGYAVGEPVRGPVQGHRGYWLMHVDVTLPAGPSFILGYFTPNTS